MKKIRFLPFLLLTPLFLMGNSPYPYGQSEYYEDFTISNLVFGEYVDYYAEYKCTFDVTNTGDKYIEISSIILKTNNKYASPYIEADMDSHYYDDCIGPNQTVTLKGYAKNTQYTLEDLTAQAYAYALYKKAEYTSVSYVSKESYQYGSNSGLVYYYNYKIEGLNVDREYYYSPLVEYSVDGVTKWKMDRGPINSDFSIKSYEEYDETKITIDNVYLVKGIERRNREIRNTWIAVWIIIIIVFSILLFISPLAIPIVFVCIHSRKKKESKASN